MKVNPRERKTNHASSLLPSPSRRLADVSAPQDAGNVQSIITAKKEFKKTVVVGEGFAKKIVGTIVSAASIRKQSVCDLAKTEGNDECLEDPLMGSREPRETCPTCFCDFEGCRGHFGMISLDEKAWFLHPFYVKDGIIAALLNIFCYTCFEERSRSTGGRSVPQANMMFNEQTRISLSMQYEQYSGIERLKALAEKAKDYQCSEGHTYTLFKKTTDNTLKQVIKDVERESDVISLFYHLTSISDLLDLNGGELHSFLGFAPIRYENFVIQVIPVIPTRARLPVIIGTSKQESGFTSLYKKILQVIRAMNLPENKTNEPSQVGFRKEIRDLYFQYIKSESKNISRGRGGKAEAYKTLKMILDGKKGLWHGNTLSGRADNSGRTVIVGDNGIKPNEVKIPQYMAEKFRIRLDVNARNLNIVADLISKGIVKTVIRNPRGGGRMEIVEITDENRDRFKLQIGDRTYRRMVSGDIAIINRQPTLHRWSIMAMKVVVPQSNDPTGLYYEAPGSESNSIGMNTIYVSGYNADFDGDEVHVHVPAEYRSSSRSCSSHGSGKGSHF